MNESKIRKSGKDDEDWSKTAQAWLTGIGIGALILAAMVVSYEIGTNHTGDQAASTPAAESTVAAPPAATQGPGRELFVTTCGTCHTLSEAGTSGAVGPNLDDLKPDRQMVESAIKIGGTGSGAMPPGLLEGTEATEVSDYVAGSAGTGG